jgi:AraC-like DNA-binding protein
MSVRNVGKLMSDDGQGLASYILQQRLEGCARWLRDPSRANMRVSDVAYEWGFGDLSHFSYSFRARFGIPPRAFRDLDRGNRPDAAR